MQTNFTCRTKFRIFNFFANFRVRFRQKVSPLLTPKHLYPMFNLFYWIWLLRYLLFLIYNICLMFFFKYFVICYVASRITESIVIIVSKYFYSYIYAFLARTMFTTNTRKAVGDIITSSSWGLRSDLVINSVFFSFTLYTFNFAIFYHFFRMCFNGTYWFFESQWILVIKY